jgi:hypothetical protein
MSFMAKKIFCVSGGLIGFVFCLVRLLALPMSGFDEGDPPGLLDFVLWYGALSFFLYVGVRGACMYPRRP